MARDPERRKSLTSDRRHAHRGGRRREDPPITYPSSVVACPACLTGEADIVAVSPHGDLGKLTDQCAACEQQFSKDA